MATKNPDVQKILSALAKLSNYYGKDPDFVLAGGGGNTSVKIGGALYIKGSGTSLATIKPEEFVALSREKVAATLQKQYSEDPLQREEEIKQDLLAARLLPHGGMRPSVETALHNLFEAQYVFHLHPWVVNAALCAKGGKQLIQRVFEDSAIWVGYCDPGYTLAKAVQQQLEEYRQRRGGSDPDYLFIQNHGPFIPGNSLEQIKRRITMLMNVMEEVNSGADDYFRQQSPGSKANSKIPNWIPAVMRGLLAEDGKLKVLAFEQPVPFIATAEGKACLTSGPMTPDQIVYCKSFPLFIRAKDGAISEEDFLKQFDDFVEKRGYLPKIVVVEGIGIYGTGPSMRDAQTALAVFLDALDLMRGTYAAGGPIFLTKKQYQFIDEWEVEQYRRKVAGSSGSSKPLENKVFIINGGSAGGLKKSLVQYLEEQGVYVHYQVEGERNSRQELIDQALIAHGGVDAAIFISEDRPGSLLNPSNPDSGSSGTYSVLFELPPVARAMALQAEAAPAWSGDIIFLQVGLISHGMTARYAAELAEMAIKVNTLVVTLPDHSHEGEKLDYSDVFHSVEYLVRQQSQTNITLNARIDCAHIHDHGLHGEHE